MIRLGKAPLLIEHGEGGVCGGLQGVVHVRLSGVASAERLWTEKNGLSGLVGICGVEGLSPEAHQKDPPADCRLLGAANEALK